MRILKLIFILCLIGTLQNPIKAQRTGSYDTIITFMGQTRTFSLFVPPNYDPAHNYQLLVGLHGLGDNSNNYRNALINTLAWPSLFDSTIFIFPDGGSDPNKDFYVPQGDEMVIPESILLAQQVYSINSNEIILQGFSLGGRSSLKYGLENPNDFKALLLNTPALQGLLDLNNEPGGASLIYNYSNASQIPIYISLGSTDAIYLDAIEQLVIRLKKNSGKVEYKLVQGMGHSVPSNSVQNALLEFFGKPETQDYDLDLFSVEMPERTCNSTVDAEVFIQNKGLQNLSSVEIIYNTGGANSQITWTGNLGLYESVGITIPNISGAGKMTLDASIGAININESDPITTNNQGTKDFEIVSASKSLQVFEGFEGNVDDWIFDETGSLFQWSVDNSISRDGQSSLFAFNTILIFNTLGARENFSSPLMDFRTVSKPTLAFDVAFNYHQYTPPYFTDTVNFADTLQVLISVDCGQSFQTIYKKGGADLATAAAPILNPLTIPATFFSPKDSTEWRRERIDLSNFSNATEAVIRFDYISSLGGSINLDNITIDDASIISNKEMASEITFEMFPNPAKDEVFIHYDYKESKELEIYSLNGSLVFSQELDNSNELRVKLGHYDRGLYILKLKGKSQNIMEKLMVN